MENTTKSKAAQDFIPVKEVRDGVIILKDGSLRGLVMVSSLNFALKSSDEQSSIIYQFQNFLNSLDFSIQIFVESKKLDIRPYLALLEERYKSQLTDLMKIQIREYINFIRNFTENSKIMAKSFFVVVPYSPTAIGKGGPLSGIMNKKGSSEDFKAKGENFEENRLQLEQRVGVVQQGLVRCGLRSFPLGTEETVELFYKIFNPGDTEKPIQLN